MHTHMYIYNTLCKDVHSWIYAMLKTQSLCTSAKSNIGDRVFLGEMEKNSFIVFLGKERHNGLLSQKLCVPTCIFW